MEPGAATVTDEDLAVRSRTDAEAFGLLYERYVDRVHAFAMSRLRDHSAAEDVTSEVFLKALRAIDRYQPILPFRAWLFQIATNAVIDHLRRRRRRRWRWRRSRSRRPAAPPSTTTRWHGLSLPRCRRRSPRSRSGSGQRCPCVSVRA